MAATVKEIREWLATLDPDEEVGVDDGGLTLVSVSRPEAYLEIGGLPDEGE